jgi:hypothetical protein
LLGVALTAVDYCRESHDLSTRPYRFFFFSREESRVHVHVTSPDGEAKFWLDPSVELARNHKLSPQQLKVVERLVREHREEILDAWDDHFGS